LSIQDRLAAHPTPFRATATRRRASKP
jgi:hypothetical protein